MCNSYSWISPIRNSFNCSFNKKHCEAQKEYLYWIAEEMQPFTSSVNPLITNLNGKLFKSNSFITHTNPFFTQLRRKWYPNGKKIIPIDLVLTPLTIAVWFWDDGSNNVENRSCCFCTNGFTKSDINIILEKLKFFGISGNIDSRKVIRVDAWSYKTLVDLVSPFMFWKCMEHKIAYREPKVIHCRDDVAEKVISLRAEGKKYKEIAKMVSVSEYVVHSIVKGKTKKHITGGAPNPKSGIKGVYWSPTKNSWYAAIRENKKLKYIGTYESVDLASIAIQQYKS